MIIEVYARARALHSSKPVRKTVHPRVTAISNALIPIGLRIRNDSTDIVEVQLRHPTSLKIPLTIASSFLIFLTCWV
jgi:hypothetical protein